MGGEKLIERGAYYVRKHGPLGSGRWLGVPCPHSCKIELAQDWAPLIRRCVRRDREALLGMLDASIDVGQIYPGHVLWSTSEFGFLRLSDAYVQSSSIMPQKRNPVSLEHSRILASRAFGEAQAVLTCAHNTPLETSTIAKTICSHDFTMFHDALRSLHLLQGALRSATWIKLISPRRAAKDFLTVTELADTLARSEGMSFREAHGLVAATVRNAVQTIRRRTSPKL